MDYINKPYFTDEERFMETISYSANPTAVQYPSQISTNLLDSLPAYFDSNLKVLSLDCFDTLIWRKSATPSDHFYTLQNKPTFKKEGISAELRQYAEKEARMAMFSRHESYEVTLHDIYQGHNPDLTHETLELLSEEEVSTEIDYCYAFPPCIQLMREAHKRGLKIIIVSDTYLRESQLRRILQAHLPSDVYTMIQHVFCSSEYKKSKSTGLFNIVMRTISHAAESIFHVGDNPRSDCIAARNAGIKSTQVTYFNEAIKELLRMRTFAAALFDPMIRYKRSFDNPFHGVFAATKISIDAPENVIGYFSLGPIMYAFSEFIRHDVDALKSQGKNVKVVFLMRDGYLPSLACDALINREMGKQVYISCFTSYAASFRKKEDVERYLNSAITALGFPDVCKQLLIPKNKADLIVKKSMGASDPYAEFKKLILEKSLLAEIYRSSTQFRKRLINHLKNAVNIGKGDTLLLVDLGYKGTTQNKLGPIFKEELGIDVIGRYLISVTTPNWEKSRRGLLDPSWCDDKSMMSIINYIGLLEKLCASGGKSVINYSENGNPLFSDNQIAEKQHQQLHEIQQRAIQFVKDAKQFVMDSHIDIGLQALRDTAMSELARMVFLPTKTELDYLKSFQYDASLGTKVMHEIFDIEKGLTALKRRGLFFMEKNIKTKRTNYPAELRFAGIEMSMAVLMQHRTGFALQRNEFSMRREPLHIIAISNGNPTQVTIEAMPTFDGYYSIIVPAGMGEYQVAIQFGLRYQWVEVESVEIIATAALHQSNEADNTQDVSQNIYLDGMVKRADRLYECLNDAGIFVYIPPEKKSHLQQVLRVVFRPIVVKQRKE